MSYTVSGSGSGIPADALEAAFTAFVHAVDEATVEGGTQFQGSVSGTEEGGRTINLTAAHVRIVDSDADRTAAAEAEREAAEES